MHQKKNVAKKCIISGIVYALLVSAIHTSTTCIKAASLSMVFRDIVEVYENVLVFQGGVFDNLFQTKEISGYS
jgi:hypothetical protein